MLKYFKKLFQRSAAAPAAAARVRPAATARPSAATRQPEAAPGVEVASLSLRAILERLPSDLKATVNQMPENDVKVILPINAIMKQLPTGSVKMSLGSLFRQAPNGTFRKSSLEDKRMIEVPLSEIFKTINPARLHRRNDQRQYEVPDDVHGLFGAGMGRNVAPGGAAASAAPQESAPEPRASLKMPGMPSAMPQSGVKPTSNGRPAPARTPAHSPTAGGSLNLSGELSLLLVEIGAGWPEGIRGELSVLTGDTKLVLPVSEVSAGLQKGKVAFTWAQVRNWLTPAPSSQINLADDTLLVLPLKIVAPAFVAATGAKKRESTVTVNQSLPDFFGPTAGRVPPPSPVAPPVEEPAPEPETLEAPALTPELPPANGSHVEAPAEDVPLSLAIEPESTPEPEPELAPVAASVAMPAVISTPAAEPSGVTLAEIFNQPGKTDWTPNELVKLTCELPGVIGAVVALEEGLVVAQKLPEGLSSETFAAFMPQIFSRLDKYTGEMQLGDTEEVTVNTAGGPCRFYRRGKLFFATLGRSGETLPAGLHVVAAELASQNS